ncbi:hypothetical protein [Methylomonas methanica]|uniref:hypothetical protein n=1 Tax=Methylomonas methanica TaxID=421 RepID=UPI00130540D8|nr:hypothetical protein [Methylomonas methanica]
MTTLGRKYHSDVFTSNDRCSMILFVWLNTRQNQKSGKNKLLPVSVPELVFRDHIPAFFYHRFRIPRQIPLMIMKPLHRPGNRQAFFGRHSPAQQPVFQPQQL